MSTGWSLWFASASITVQAGVGSEVSLWLETVAGVRSPSMVSLWLGLGGGAGTVMGVRGQSVWGQDSVCTGAEDWEASATPLPLPLAEPRWVPGRHEAARSCSQDQVGTPARPEALGAGDRGRSQEPRVPSPENAEREGAWRPLFALSSSLPSPRAHCPPLCPRLSPSLLLPPSVLHPRFPNVCLSSLFPIHSPTEPCPQAPASALRRQGHAVSKLSEMVQHLRCSGR